MNRFLIILVSILFLALPLCAAGETILWEDDAGQVILRDGGEVSFISPDGSESELFTLDALREAAESLSQPEDEAGSDEWVDEALDAISIEEGVPAAPNFTYRRTLRYGDNGDAVRELQQRLLDLGFYEARVSGGFYRVTQNAVKAFQRQNGLTADGVAGRETQEALFSAQAVSASATPKPTATPTPAQYKLMVDVTNQITRAYTYDAQGEYTVLVREMICSTGTAKNPTPLGTTIMPSTRARWGYFPTWDSHAQYLTRIDKANAFHSVLYTEANEMALSVSSYKALGTRQSHGCVRLMVSDAKWIYDNCKAGTIITVYESEEYDPEYTMTLARPLNSETLRERAAPAATPAPIYSRDAWPTTYRTLSRGKTGEDVFMLQSRLAELGYYHGSITGGYYGGTIAAVEAFQRDYGLKVDGAAGKQTQSVLFSSACDPTPAPESALEDAEWAESPILEEIIEESPSYSPTLTPSPMPTALPTPTPSSSPTRTPPPSPAEWTPVLQDRVG